LELLLVVVVMAVVAVVAQPELARAHVHRGGH